jgi:hypothetical protein
MFCRGSGPKADIQGDAANSDYASAYPQLIDGGPANPKWLSPRAEGRR